MNTGFACPACRVPLVLRFQARAAAATSSEKPFPKCPNPFCRTELPSRRAEMEIVYALVGTAIGDAPPATDPHAIPASGCGLIVAVPSQDRDFEPEPSHLA